MAKHRSIGDEFRARLARFEGAWKRGLAFALILRVFAWAVGAAAIYLVADYFLGFDEEVRFWLSLLLPLGGVAAATPEAVGIVRRGLAETAERVDRLARHRRKDLLTAWELHQRGASSAAQAADSASGAGDEGNAFSAFLVERSVGAAMARLGELAPSIVRPRELTATRARTLGLTLIVALGVAALLGADALFTIVPRMLWPGRDIPPYSRYRFELNPASPTVLYGSSVEVSATIGGAPVNDRVWILTRGIGQKPRRAACFQSGGDRYAQRIENVTAPVDFCFATGRARSRWHRVDVQWQPQVVMARVRLVSPSYTRLPAREFAAGQEDVAGVRGSAVTLTLTSNRPLKDGTLTVTPRRSLAAGEQVVEGRRVSDRIVAFSWTVESDAEAKATLRDVRGTPTAEPLVVHQRMVPDEPPKVTLSEPAPFSMATPSASIKVVGAVDDDFGIEQVDWIRSMLGFNDRGMTMRKGASGTRFEFESELKLGALGVDPGETLEFYAEALDNNPYLPGAGASGLARIKIISDDEYAEMIRNREDLAQFMARYTVAMEAMNRVTETLGELHGLVLWRNPDKARLEKVVKKVMDAHTEAESVFRQLARDFAAYDSEKTLKKTAADVVEKLGQNKKELAAMTEPVRENTAKVEAMLKRIGAEAESLTQQSMSAALAEKLARVMDGAARFQVVVQRQTALVRWLKQRYGTRVDSADLPFLPGYGEHQAEIAQALSEFVTNVTAAADALPDAFKVLRRDVKRFVAALKRSGAADHMVKAVEACKNTDAARACREAQLALEKLQSTLQDCNKKGEGSEGDEGPEGDKGSPGNSFADMCRGQVPDIGPGDMKMTLQQLFRALCRKRGVGDGDGMGGGEGSDGTGANGGMGEGEGSGSASYSALSTPVYGPERSAVARPGGAGTGDAGEGSGRGTGGAERRPAVVEQMPRTGTAAPSGESIQYERLPPKYQEAVKRYFQNGKEGGAP